MSDLNEKFSNLRKTVLNEQEYLKPYSIRIPDELSAWIEALADYSRKSKNLIITELLDLGVSYFMSNLDDPVALHDIRNEFEMIKRDIFVERTQGDK